MLYSLNVSNIQEDQCSGKLLFSNASQGATSGSVFNLKIQNLPLMSLMLTDRLGPMGRDDT